MSINRHNYEEYFILYWDNELTASQKQAVENFVKENADLQEEFKIFGETRFTPDTIQFEQKETLLNNSFINITNYEEQLLCYIDDELNTGQRKEVEKFVSQYPAIQQELALLKRTKLQPEAEIVFHNKSVLYRREEKVRVISMTWFRVAVAAVLILIAGFVTLRLVNVNKGGDVPPVAKNDKSINPASDQLNKQEVNQSKANDLAQKEQQANLAKTNNKPEPAQTSNADKKKVQKPAIENTVVNSIAVYRPENKNNLPKERNKANQTVNEQNNSETAIASVDIPSIKAKDNSAVEKYKAEETNNLFEGNGVTKSASPSFANNIISDDKPVKEKGGLKEFLRKTTRVFERRTKIQTTTDDNKLLVGAFAVSLK